MPAFIEDMNVRVTHRLDEALEWCDVAMSLRIQLERQEQGLFPSLREYHERFGIKRTHLQRYPDFVVMPPGTDQPGRGTGKRSGRQQPGYHPESGDQRTGRTDGGFIPAQRRKSRLTRSHVRTYPNP